jgi:uncharacterized protein
MCVRNKTRGTVLAKHLITLNSNFHDTLRFLNRRGIPRNCALLIAPCTEIHTVGMRKSVDIVYLNRNGHVVKMFKSLPPDCVADSPQRAVSAVELPADAIGESDTTVGDEIELDPS